MFNISINKKLLLAYTGLTLAPLFWAGNAVLATAFVDSVPPLSLSFWRWLLALALLLPFSFLALKRESKVILSKLPHIFCLATLSVVGFSTLLYQAALSSSATNIGLINSTIPIFILLVGMIFFHQELTRKITIGVMLALLGVYWVIVRGDLTVLLNNQWLVGDLLMLVAVVCWALYTISLKIFDLQLSKKSLLASQMIAGLTILTPITIIDVFFFSGSFQYSDQIFAGIIYTAIFPGILAYLFWSIGVSAIGPARSGIFMYLIPIFSALLSFTFFEEKIAGFHIVGGIFILLGLYITTTTPS